MGGAVKCGRLVGLRIGLLSCIHKSAQVEDIERIAVARNNPWRLTRIYIRKSVSFLLCDFVCWNKTNSEVTSQSFFKNIIQLTKLSFKIMLIIKKIKLPVRVY